MSSVPPTLSFRLASAYGVPARAPAQIEPKPAARAQPAVAAQALRITPMPAATKPTNPLVAAAVPGKIRFDALDTAPSAGAALPFYRHPADKNAAATAINVGRSLDANA